MSEAAPTDAELSATRSSDLAGLRDLVRQAFEQARQSGRQEWQVMTTAVLKNRLLQLTSRQFSESTYGVDAVLDLVRLIPDTVSVDDSTKPPRVTLLSAATREPQPSRPEVARIRTDLWNAVFDFSGPGEYIWNGTQAEQAVTPTPTGALRLPTLTEAEFDGWRHEFSLQHPDLDLEAWGQKAYSTYGLPGALRGQWNRFIRFKALGRLHMWFDENKISPPSDMVEYTESRTDSTTNNSETEALRRYLLKCVAEMRPSELRALLIPASVAARVSR
ncbi:hypothetical protein [Cellulosimicrobium sp. RS]|uniref:hypothetical protein n=1 Tax=Cellulosimicrobium sp. RS TaxID=3381347 RepID=UPI0038FC516A